MVKKKMINLYESDYSLVTIDHFIKFYNHILL